LHPAISQVIGVEPRRWRRALLSKSTWQELRDLRALLQRRAYDVVIDSQGLIKSALIARLAPGMHCGLDWASAREPLRPFYDRTFNVSWKLHAVERNRQLAAQALGYVCQYTCAIWPAPAAARARCAGMAGGTDVDAVCSAASWHQRARQAMAEHQWIKLADHLQHKGLIRVCCGELRTSISQRAAREGAQARVDRASLSMREIASLLGGAQVVFGWTPGSRISRARWTNPRSESMRDGPRRHRPVRFDARRQRRRAGTITAGGGRIAAWKQATA
jgi:heptosyltransferase-1